MYTNLALVAPPRGNFKNKNRYTLAMATLKIFCEVTMTARFFLIAVLELSAQALNLHVYKSRTRGATARKF